MGYWIGPARVYIPNKITGVPSMDRMNTEYSDGTTSKMFSHKTWYTVEEYREKLAVRHVDNHWYWEPNKPSTKGRQTDGCNII